MRRILSYIYLGVAWLMVVGLLATILMAGMALFVRNSLWETHMGIGYLSGWPGVILIVLAIALRIPRQLTPWLAAVFVLHIVQTTLPILREDLPYVAALHPLNASILTYLAYLHAKRARELLLGRSVADEQVARLSSQIEV